MDPPPETPRETIQRALARVKKDKTHILRYEMLVGYIDDRLNAILNDPSSDARGLIPPILIEIQDFNKFTYEP